MAKKKQRDMSVDVLGTKYAVRIRNEKEDPELKGLNGYCMTLEKVIVADDKQSHIKGQDDITKRTLRHELMHAFFYESGLDNEAPWASSEEQLVDWFALQLPKIIKACQEIDAL